MNTTRRLVASLVAAAALTTGITVSSAQATAPCNTSGGWGVIGSYVSVAGGTARSSCVKINSVNRYNNTVRFTGGIQDTATDGRYADLWVNFRVNGVWTGWKYTANTGYEAGFASIDRSYTLVGTPTHIAFLACRDNGSSTDACGSSITLNW